MSSDSRSFDSIVGQIGAKRRLVAALESDRVPGGYLFLGLSGVGKFTAALALARALLCEGDGPHACGACSACTRSEKRVHPNLHVAGEGPDVTRIKVEEIREIQGRLSLRPLEGVRQVVIVDNADRLGDVSGNALLKTLEEPPPGAVLILVAAEPLRVLETIRSRSQEVRFSPLGTDQVRTVLERSGMEREEAEALARCAGGSPGRALALRRLGFPERADRVYERFLDLGREDPVAIAEDLVARPSGKVDAAAERIAIQEMLKLLAHLARDAMVASVGIRDGVRSVPSRILDSALERFGSDSEQWGRVLRRLLEAAHNVRYNVSVDLVVADLLLDVEQAWKNPPSPSNSPPRSATAR